MTDSMTVEGWSDDVELVCKNIEHNAIELSRLHKKHYLHLSNQQIFYRIPIIVLSSINSIFSVGLSVYVDQSIVSTTNCIISLFCGIISSVELYFQLTKRIETELLSYREYYLLSTKINSCLKLDREHRMETSGIDFLREIENKYNTLFEASNVLIEDYTDELQLRRIVYPPGDKSHNPLRVVGTPPTRRGHMPLNTLENITIK
jgi:hypothetical protein